MMEQKKIWGVVLNLDNLVLNNYWRKYQTYRQIGWDDVSIKQYLSHKQNTMQIASFSTPTVSFSASSRRNRFYSIYNQLEMLDQDVAWGSSVSALQDLSTRYHIYIISARTEDLREKTLEVMARLGFVMENVSIFFKKSLEQLYSYRKKCIKEITKNHPTGVGICLNPSDTTLFKDFGYTPVGMTSLKNKEEFNGHIDIVCEDWTQLLTALNCTGGSQ